MKYMIIDKESGEILYTLNATTKCQAVIEAFNVLEVELVSERAKQEYKRTCLDCQQEFITTDGRYFRCTLCQGVQGREHLVSCRNLWCGREFTTRDRRAKQCKYCRERNYRVNVPGMKQYCSVCDKTECLKTECPYLKRLS